MGIWNKVIFKDTCWTQLSTNLNYWAVLFWDFTHLRIDLGNLPVPSSRVKQSKHRSHLHHSRIRMELILILLASSHQNLYDIRLLHAQCWTPDDGQRPCPKHAEFHSKNKVEKLVHLIGFVIRMYHGAQSSECQIWFLIFPHLEEGDIQKGLNSHSLEKTEEDPEQSKVFSEPQEEDSDAVVGRSHLTTSNQEKKFQLLNDTIMHMTRAKNLRMRRRLSLHHVRWQTRT